MPKLELELGEPASVAAPLACARPSITLRRRIIIIGILLGCLFALFPPMEQSFVTVSGERVWHPVGMYPVFLPVERRSVRVEDVRTALGLAAIAGLTTAAALLVPGRR